MTDLDFATLWEVGLRWDQFYRAGMKQETLWRGVYQSAQLPAEAVETARRHPHLRLLVITEDWCGDAANTIPILQRLVEVTPGADLRILERDQYPAVMDRYLTGTSRSIPIVIGLSETFTELGHWGPRPTELQTWVKANLQIPKEERYAETRRWYARDRGATTLREVLAVVQGG